MALSPLPQVIAGEEQCLDDLFAWSASYLRGLGPLSGLVRTLSFKQLIDALSCQPPTEGWKVAGGVVGLIVAEVCCRGGPRIGIGEAAGALPHSTLSFAISRAWALGYPSHTIHELVEQYIQLSHGLGRSSNEEISRAVVNVASTVVGMKDIPGSKQRKRGSTDRWWDLLRGGVGVYDVMSEVLRNPNALFGDMDVYRTSEMTAEEKVQFFDVLVPTLVTKGGSAEQSESAFALALAAFMCRPGFAQQATLVRHYQQELPEAILWLGALQSFSPLADVLLLQSGTGWRIAREVYRSSDLFAAPRAEASGAEVNKLLRARSKSILRLIDKARVEIEIYPMIVSTFRGGREKIDQGDLDDREHREGVQHRSRMYFERLSVLETQLRDALRTLRDVQYWQERTDSGKSQGGKR